MQGFEKKESVRTTEIDESEILVANMLQKKKKRNL